MRNKTAEMYPKVLDMLRGATGYTPYKKLTTKTGLSSGSITKIINIMRIQGIGVVKRHRLGVVLSEYMTIQDATHNLRTWNTQYTRNMVSLKAAYPDLERVFGKAKLSKGLLAEATSSLMISETEHKKSGKALLQIIDKVL